MTPSPQGGQRLRHRLPFLPIHKFPKLNRFVPKLSLVGPEFVMDSLANVMRANSGLISS